MKKLTMLCAAVLTVCGIAGAQSNGSMVKVHFDYPVMVGETLLPAGDCTIARLDPASSDNVILLVRCEQHVQTTAVVTRLDPIEARPDADASVTLSRRGDTYRLQRVWLSIGEGFQVLEPAE